MAGRPTVPPSAGPVFPLPGYEDSQWGAFENFADLERFIDNNMELTQFFVAHPRDPMTEDWLAQVRGVVPDSLPGIMEHQFKSAMLWQVIGRALNLSADNCGGVLAELYWVRRYDPEVIAQRNDLALGDSGAHDTGCPSSEDESMSSLYAKVSAGIDAASHATVATDREEKQEGLSVDPGEGAEMDALFAAHLDRDHVLPEDQLPAPASDIPPPIQRDESGDRAAPAMDTPLRKTKRETSPAPAPRITPAVAPRPTTLERYGFTSNRPPSSSSSGRRTTTRRGSGAGTARKSTTSRKRKRN
ncbi:hypothetical protein [Acrocarpospora sp. B8E8]|uniref:hypothetical protein n=1 Tax=Acrocarpospora sp. B8E8 TaxID=3153572 RepID=UPI00325ED76C